MRLLVLRATRFDFVAACGAASSDLELRLLKNLKRPCSGALLESASTTGFRSVADRHTRPIRCR